MTFLTINAHNRMLDVTCHRNIESTYLTLLSRYSVTELSRGEREREGELKLLYQLMVKYTNISVTRI
jgi:hypothetical protein